MNNLRTRFENGEEVVTVNGHTGVLINKREIENFRGPIPLSEYPINDDPNPLIVHKKCETPHHSTQEITVRYLEPPALPPPGEIIIQQEAPVVPPPAPPIVIKTAAPIIQQKEPLVYREAPPKMPIAIGRKIIKILAPKVPPPPRKVIIQKPPPVADRAQPIIIERWLAPKIQPRRVIFDGVVHHNVQHQPVRNEIHECEAPRVIVNKQFKDLGVARMDPNEYWNKYGNTLIEAHNLPDFVRDIRPPPGLLLASDVRPDHYIPHLEGDVHLLSNLDLHREGLSEYANFIRGAVASGHSTGGHRDTYYESSRSTSSPPRGSVIRTLVDSAFRSDGSGSHAHGYPTSSTSVYKSTTITDTSSHPPPGNGGGYSSML